MGSLAWSLYQRMRTGLSSAWLDVGVQSQGIAVFSPDTATTSCFVTEKRIILIVFLHDLRKMGIIFWGKSFSIWVSVDYVLESIIDFTLPIQVILLAINLILHVGRGGKPKIDKLWQEEGAVCLIRDKTMIWVRGSNDQSVLIRGE